MPSPGYGTPRAEIDADADLVRALLQDQHPDLADADIRLVAQGWDNYTFRIGDHLAARVPRIERSVPLLEREQRWLPGLAARLPGLVPAPVRLGLPSERFPWPWSVMPWVPGDIAGLRPLAPGEAGRLGRVLATLHQPAPRGFPRSPYRGIPLDRIAPMEPRLDRIACDLAERGLDHSALLGLWRRAVEAPIDVAETVIHGDPHPKNVITREGRLMALIDWGDMTVGDRANDLGAAWMLFPVEAYGELWRGYGPISVATRTRALGWATALGVLMLETGLAGDPLFERLGWTTLDRVLAGAGSL